VLGAGIGEHRQSQLPDPPQALEFGGVYQLDDQTVTSRRFVKRYYIMERISETPLDQVCACVHSDSQQGNTGIIAFFYDLL
jgi:hypothetical protein